MLRWLNSPASETQVTHGQRLWLYILASIIMLLLVTPTLIVIPMSFSDSQYLEFPPENWSTRWYQSYFSSSEWMQATVTSLKAAFLTTLVATPGSRLPFQDSGSASAKCRRGPRRRGRARGAAAGASGYRLCSEGSDPEGDEG